MKRSVNGVDVTFWNPRVRNLGGLPLGPRMRNFGDLLGPWVVRRMLQARGVHVSPSKRRDLVTAGTIMYLAPQDATIWGTGTRDTVARARYTFTRLDVRAVRGPRTRALLTDMGIRTPEVYGDPGLVVPAVFPELLTMEKRHDVVYVPNYADYRDWRAKNVLPLINPRSNLMRVLKEIASSRAVVASSLHALILADALGIPSVRVSSGVEGDFKYHDYALGAGRPLHIPLSTPVGALAAVDAAPDVNVKDLIDAFPLDLWRKGEETAIL